MKIRILLFICSYCILSTTYAQKVLSLNPLYKEQDVVLIPGIEGLWNVSDFDMKLSFKKAGDNFYLLKYGSEKNPTVFEAVFVKIKDQVYLDLSGTLPETLGDEDYRNSFVTSHSLYKLYIKKDSIKLFELNYSWLYEHVVRGHLALKYEWVKSAMLLTLTTQDLKTFLNEKTEQGLFKESLTLVNKHENKNEIHKNVSYDPGLKPSAIITQKCKPSFPLKDGWLGGDGDVSFPINATTTLFIFSDTYVANKDQQSRMEPGMRMVSNTVAVESCLPSAKPEVKYFWNNMYSDDPQPIFKSYTNRFRYWVNDAFMLHGNLYVLLEKIGPLLGAAPDDVFSFSQLGFTLAKISNPGNLPNEWEIEYIPIPVFCNPFMGIHCHVLQDDYIYFFVSRYDKAQVLVRKQLEFIDNIGKPFEYFALNKTWKAGLDTTDMDTIVKGFRCNTVNYHPEMKQWVMITDIKFKDNKINMRTAAAITGPWSGEKTIYEIPETSPGNSLYRKTNFCYLSRECIQNYDVKTHTMYITYDVNNPSSSEINSNPQLYTPRLISVSLMNLGGR